MKNWPKLKSVCNIKIFLGFANFYQQVIQRFSKIAAPIILIQKTTELSDMLTFDRNKCNGELVKFSINNGSCKIVNKPKKSKDKKLFKFQKILMSKKLSKIGN